MLNRQLFCFLDQYTNDVIDVNSYAPLNRNSLLHANQNGQAASSLDFGDLERGAYLGRETPPALVLANGRGDVCHKFRGETDQRENLTIRDTKSIVIFRYVIE